MADLPRNVGFDNDPVVLINYTPLEEEAKHSPSKLSSWRTRARAKSDSSIMNQNNQGKSHKHSTSLSGDLPLFPSEVSILDGTSKQPLILKKDLPQMDVSMETVHDKSLPSSLRAGSEEKETDSEELILTPSKQPSVKKLQKQNKELTKKNQQLLKAMEALKREREVEKEKLKVEKKGRRNRSSSREKSLESEELGARELSHDYHGIELQRRIVELEILLAKREGELAALQHRLSTNSHLVPLAGDLAQGLQRDRNKTLLQKFIDEQDANIRLVSENHDLKLKVTSLEAELEKIHSHQQHLQEQVQAVTETKAPKKRLTTFGFRRSGRKTSAAVTTSGGQGLADQGSKQPSHSPKVSASRLSLEGSLSEHDIHNLLGRKSGASPANGTQSGSSTPKIILSQTAASVDSQILQTSLMLTLEEKASLEKQLESLKEELKAHHQLSRESAKNECIVGTKTEVERLTSSLLTSSQEKETLWNENENLKNELEDLRAERNALAASIRGMEIKANLKQKQEMEFLTSENEALTKEIKTSMANMDGMQTTLNRLKRELATKEVKENELRVRTRKLEQENDKLVKEVKELKENLLKERKGVDEKDATPRKTSSKRKNSDSQKPPSSPHKMSASRKRSGTTHNPSPLSPTRTHLEPAISVSETLQAPKNPSIPFPVSSTTKLKEESTNAFLPRPSHERTKSSPVFIEEVLVPTGEQELSSSGKEKRAVAMSTTLPIKEKALKVTGRASSTPSLADVESTNKGTSEVTTSCHVIGSGDKRKQSADSVPVSFPTPASLKHPSSSAVNSLVRMFDKFGTNGPQPAEDGSRVTKDQETPEVLVIPVTEGKAAMVSSVQPPMQKSASLSHSREDKKAAGKATDLNKDKSKSPSVPKNSGSRNSELQNTAEPQKCTTDSSTQKEENALLSSSPSRKTNNKESEASVKPPEPQKVLVVHKSPQKNEQMSPNQDKEMSTTSSAEVEKHTPSHKRTPSNTSGTFLKDVNSPVRKLASFFASKGDSPPSTFQRERKSSKTDPQGPSSDKKMGSTPTNHRETKMETTGREQTASAERIQKPRRGTGSINEPHPNKTQHVYIPPTTNKGKENTQKEDPPVVASHARVSPTQITSLTITKPKPPPSSSPQQSSSPSPARDSSSTLHSSLEKKKPIAGFPLTTSTLAPTTQTISQHKPLAKTASVPLSSNPHPVATRTENGSTFVTSSGMVTHTPVAQSAPTQSSKPYLSKMVSSPVIHHPPVIHVPAAATTTVGKTSPMHQQTVQCQPQEKTVVPTKGLVSQHLAKFDVPKRSLSQENMFQGETQFHPAKLEAASVSFRNTVPVTRSSKRPASLYVTNSADRPLSSLISKLQEKEAKSVSPVPTNNKNSRAISPVPGCEPERTQRKAELTRPHTMYFDENPSPKLKRITSLSSSPLGIRSSKKQRLLRWCQLHTIDYENISISNFGESFSNGLAFCALLHHFIPDQIPYHTLSPHSQRKNFETAFKVAESIGIPALLDVDDMVALAIPDWMSVMTYVSYIYKHFSGFGDEKATSGL